MIDYLAERYRGVSVLVAGDVMLDEYIIGSVSRISPEAPVPVLDVRTRRSVLGGAANVAANLAALGTRPVVVGLAALDPAGREVRNLLSAAGISTEGLVDSKDRGTIHKTRIVAGQQQVVRIDSENRSDLGNELLEEAIEKAVRLLEGTHVLVLSDYAKGLLNRAFCAALIEAGRKQGLPVIVDPKSRDLSKYRGCTVITPNLSEAGLSSGMTIDSETAVREAGNHLLRELPGTSVLITRGAEGMTLFRHGEEPVTVSTVAREVFDVVGAGDTVIATLAASLGCGMDMPLAMRLANVAAGIVVEKPGTATVTTAEISARQPLAGFPGMEISPGVLPGQL